MRYGIASCDISPPFSTTMHGYGVRKDHFDGVNDPLQLTAVTFEEDGRMALICAADICVWPNDGRTEDLINHLATELHIQPAQILLNASHTHGGPSIPDSSAYIALHDHDAQSTARYWDWLAQRVIETAKQAAMDMREGSLHLFNGHSQLPLNRRLLKDGQIINAPNPQGSVDDQMQLIMIRNREGGVAAVMMRLSCHPVATGPQHMLTADFVGAWRQAFREVMGPGVQPIFLQGAAGDMRPRCAADGMVWRAMRHNELPFIGRELMTETLQAIISSPGRRLDKLQLNGRVSTYTAVCETTYTKRSDLDPLRNAPDPYKREFVQHCESLLDQGKPIPTSVDFRIQTLWLDHELAMVGINCEPLHKLGQIIQVAFAPHQAIIMGYTGGCLGYCAEATESVRGGYELESYIFMPWSGPWTHNFDQLLLSHLVTSPHG